jgi:hypothetical protein
MSVRASGDIVADPRETRILRDRVDEASSEAARRVDASLRDRYEN